jgi:hypothetical protein
MIIKKIKILFLFKLLLQLSFNKPKLILKIFNFIYIFISTKSLEGQ